MGSQFWPGSRKHPKDNQAQLSLPTARRNGEQQTIQGGVYRPSRKHRSNTLPNLHRCLSSKGCQALYTSDFKPSIYLFFSIDFVQANSDLPSPSWPYFWTYGEIWHVGFVWTASAWALYHFGSSTSAVMHFRDISGLVRKQTNPQSHGLKPYGYCMLWFLIMFFGVHPHHPLWSQQLAHPQSREEFSMSLSEKDPALLLSFVDGTTAVGQRRKDDG